MKSKLIYLTILLAATTMIARIVVPFPGWNDLESSSEIVAVVRCGKPIRDAAVDNGAQWMSEIEIIAFLKGTNNVVSGRLETDRCLQQGIDYLVFASFRHGVYDAFETYKVVPIGDHFPINSLSGKHLDEQIKILSEHALFYLNREIQQDEAQKEQLKLLSGSKSSENTKLGSPIPR